MSISRSDSSSRYFRNLLTGFGLSLAMILAPAAWAQTSTDTNNNQPPAAQASGAQNAPSATQSTQSAPSTTGSTTSTAQSAPNTTANTQSAPAAAPASDQSSAAPAVNTTQANSAQNNEENKKYPHNGGENDVNAIGNRNIGGRGMGNWYSVEREIAMGKAAAQQFEATVRLIHDPVIDEYVNRVGQNIVRNSDAKVPFTIKVVDTDSINAMALPGGFFYVNSGLILAADNEAEMAGAMAHEIAHVAAHHTARQMTRGEWANLAYLPLIFVGGGAGYAARAAASLAVPMGFMKFQRGFEAEADHLGMEYMYKAGYDPNAFVGIMEKFAALEKKKPGLVEKAFESHPATPDRVKAAEHEIATILPPRESYILDTSEFEDVKARLAAIENKHKIQDHKDKNRPTLRRASAENPDANNPNGDRPVLKRRDDNPNQ